jgi:hypothetical protein
MARKSAQEMVRYPLAGYHNTRLSSSTKDQRFKNCFVEIVPGTDEASDPSFVTVHKRPGYTVKDDTTNVAQGRGIYQWNGQIFTVVGDRIYRGTTEVSASGNRLTTTTGVVHFAEQQATAYLIVQEGNEIWTIDASYVLKNIGSNGDAGWGDADFPAAIVPGLVSLDTYTFVMDSSGQIYNSVVGDVTNWTSGDSLNSKLEPDDGVTIIKWQNYIASFGTNSLEYFYDAANSSGSPLDPVEGSTSDIGCAAEGSVWSDEDNLIWVGKSKAGGIQVYNSTGGLPEALSTAAINRILQQEQLTIDTATAFGLRASGHLFYILTVPTAVNSTWVCDVENKLWYEWTSFDGASTEDSFRLTSHTEYDGKHYLLDRSNGKSYELDFDIYQDDSNAIRFEVVTKKLDMGVTRSKFLHRLVLVGDQQTSTSAVTLDWTDDDYQNYGTSRSLDVNKQNPTAYNLGSFTRRAFRVKHTANTPLRLESLELFVSGGEYIGGNQ